MGVRGGTPGIHDHATGGDRSRDQLVRAWSRPAGAALDARAIGEWRHVGLELDRRVHGGVAVP